MPSSLMYQLIEGFAKNKDYVPGLMSAAKHLHHFCLVDTDYVHAYFLSQALSSLCCGHKYVWELLQHRIRILPLLFLFF